MIAGSSANVRLPPTNKIFHGMAQLSTVRSSSVKLNGKRGDALIRGPSAFQTLAIPPGAQVTLSGVAWRSRYPSFLHSLVRHACVRHFPVPTRRVSPSDSSKLFNTSIKSGGKGKKDRMAETTNHPHGILCSTPPLLIFLRTIQ